MMQSETAYSKTEWILCKEHQSAIAIHRQSSDLPQPPALLALSTTFTYSVIMSYNLRPDAKGRKGRLSNMGGSIDGSAVAGSSKKDQRSTGEIDIVISDSTDGESASNSVVTAPRTQHPRKSEKTRGRRRQQADSTREGRIASSKHKCMSMASLTEHRRNSRPYDNNDEAMRQHMEEQWHAGMNAEIAQTLEHYYTQEMVLRTEMERVLRERDKALARAEDMSPDLWATDDDEAGSCSGHTEPDETVQSLLFLMVE
ncbi:hypothetical protein BJV74DRAFT_275154 [Russula compacta]|nr:hypothetical protein BJV74DRAFT_275154 [Russula compacta]